MLKKGQRSKRIVECIVPIPAFREMSEVIEAETSTKIAKRMRGLIRPSGASELQRIDPWAEGMSGKSPEETFLCSMPVRDYGATCELFF